MKKIALIAIGAIIIVVLFFKLITASKSNSQTFYTAPTTTSLHKGDESFLKINTLQNKYQVSLLEKDFVTDDIKEVENFIIANKSIIDYKKIIVSGNPKSKGFELVKLLLKKNGVEKFRVNEG